MVNLLSSLSKFDILFSIFLLSLPLGSFYNVVALRTLSGESYMSTEERSHCNSCGHQLHWNDLIPVVSWLLLKGKCRYCGANIPGMYSLWEFFTAASYTYLVYRYGFTIYTLVQVILITIMIWASVTDYTERTVPQSFIIWGYILVTGLMFYSNGLPYVKLLLGLPFMMTFMYIFYGKSPLKLVKTDYILFGLAFVASGYKICIFALIIAMIARTINYRLKKREGKEYFIPYLTWGVLITHLLTLFI